MPVQSIDFNNLVGGLNTAYDNEMVEANEFVELKNIDIADRGALQRRVGMTKVYSPPIEGNGQGFFRLMRKGRNPLFVYAIGGNLYRESKDYIQLNEVLTYEFDSAADTYKIIKLPLANFKSGSSVVFDKENDFTLTQVLEITAANQITFTETHLKISLSNDDTGWTDTPNSTQMRDFFTNRIIGITYEVTSEKIIITGLDNGFQKNRTIGAVQLNETLYIATGTKLVEFAGGAKANVIEPYKPSPLEALYIGTNALADDPYNYMSDGVSNELRIDGVTSSMTIGVINKETTLKIYISKPDSITEVEYKISYRKVGGLQEWKVLNDWSAVRDFKFIPDQTGEYEFDVYARDKNNPTPEARFIVPKWQVKEIDENRVRDFSPIHRCNRIILHWKRLIMYGNDFGSSMIYISDLDKPSFFPTTNSLSFENKEMGEITSLVRYRDMIVAFTTNSIQALFGTSPADFKRFSLNTEIGCIAPLTTKIVDNVIVFLSRDGVYALESVGNTEERANVTKLDDKVKNIIEKDENACATVFNDQYRIYFPNKKRTMRSYFRQRWAWTKDESDLLDISFTEQFEQDLFMQRKSTGAIYKRDENVLDDDGHIYEDLIITKEYDFSQPYNDKKLKHIKMLFSKNAGRAELYLSLVGDGNYIFEPTTRKYEVIDGEVVFTEVTKPNIQFAEGTVLGDWIMGTDAFGQKDTFYYIHRVSGRFKRLRMILLNKKAVQTKLVSYGYMYVMGRTSRK